MIDKEEGIDQLLAGGDGQFETLSFYDGTISLFYDDNFHVYFRETEDGSRIAVPGSTTVIGACVDKSPALMQWATNEALNLLRTNLWTPEFCGIDNSETIVVSKHDLEKLFLQAKFAHREIKEAAGAVGQIAHKWLEDLLNAQIAGVEYDAPLPENEQARNAVLAALDWMEKHKFRPTHSECKIYSLEYDYSGTLDKLGYMTGCGDFKCCPFVGEIRVLGDFKTSGGLYDTYRAQVASYRAAWEEEHPDDLIGACVVLHLGKKDGKFDTILITQEEFDQDFDGFLGSLKAYCWLEQLKVQRKLEKADAKAEKKRLKAQQDALKKATKKAGRKVRKTELPALEMIPTEDAA